MQIAEQEQDTQPRKVAELWLAMNASGMSQKEICDKAGLHNSVLSRVLNRYQKLSPEGAERLAETLGVEVKDLGPIVRW
jgi:transcriptional regulator with XRE-family HTH domain